MCRLFAGHLTSLYCLMFLAVTIALMCAVALGRDAAGGPTSQPLLRATLVAAAAGVVIVFAQLVTRSAVRARAVCGLGIHTREKHWEYWRGLHVGVWFASAILVVFTLDWCRLVRGSWRLDRWPLVDELAILAPLVLPWIASWYFFSEREVNALSRQPHTAATRWQFVFAHARLVLGVALLPVLLICLVADVAELFAPGSTQSAHAAVIYLLPLLAITLGYPWLLARVWQTDRLPDGTLREQLEQLAAKHRIRIGRMLLWDTDERVLNAAVAGVLPRLRYVFLTDVLVKYFSVADVRAAFAHELGHLRHGHLWLRFLVLFVPLSLWATVTDFGRLREAGLSEAALNPHPTAISLGVPLAASIAFLVLGVGWYSRRLEHEADLWACLALAESGDGQPKALGEFLSVLERLVGTQRGWSSWLHPSWRRRRDFLIRATGDAAFRRRFRWQMRVLATALYLTASLPLWRLVNG